MSKRKIATIMENTSGSGLKENTNDTYALLVLFEERRKIYGKQVGYNPGTMPNVFKT